MEQVNVEKVAADRNRAEDGHRAVVDHRLSILLSRDCVLAVWVRSKRGKLIAEQLFKVVGVCECPCVSEHCNRAVSERVNIFNAVGFHKEIEEFLTHADDAALFGRQAEQILRDARFRINQFGAAEDQLQQFLQRSELALRRHLTNTYHG